MRADNNAVAYRVGRTITAVAVHVQRCIQPAAHRRNENLSSECTISIIGVAIFGLVLGGSTVVRRDADPPKKLLAQVSGPTISCGAPDESYDRAFAESRPSARPANAPTFISTRWGTIPRSSAA